MCREWLLGVVGVSVFSTEDTMTTIKRFAEDCLATLANEQKLREGVDWFASKKATEAEKIIAEYIGRAIADADDEEWNRLKAAIEENRMSRRPRFEIRRKRRTHDNKPTSRTGSAGVVSGVDARRYAAAREGGDRHGGEPRKAAQPRRRDRRQAVRGALRESEETMTARRFARV